MDKIHIRYFVILRVGGFVFLVVIFEPPCLNIMLLSMASTTPLGIFLGSFDKTLVLHNSAE